MIFSVSGTIVAKRKAKNKFMYVLKDSNSGQLQSFYSFQEFQLNQTVSVPLFSKYMFHYFKKD